MDRAPVDRKPGPAACAAAPVNPDPTATAAIVMRTARGISRQTMAFPDLWKIRNNTGGPIAPQLGRHHENVGFLGKTLTFRQPALACMSARHARNNVPLRS